MYRERFSYKVHITDEFGNKLKPELFLLEQDAINWSVSQQAKTGHNYFIEDLKLDPDWLLETARRKRLAEYPTIQECVEALLEEIEGRPEKITELMMKRAEIKEKYPLPNPNIKDLK